METIETNNSTTINWYKVVDNTVTESWLTTDVVYSLWETKEQLTIWNEVAKPKELTWTIDTASATLADRVYTLSVANPDWKIFSLWIDWMEKTFKIWYFANTPLAYSTLETQLQDWLWIDYTVTYVSWTNYSISKYDWSVVSISHPNLVRTITLTWFDTISKIDVIVDWVTVTLNWPTHSWSASAAITYLESQLSTSLYYMNDDSNVLTIARKDWAIPTITEIQYNLYTYRVNYITTDTPSSWQYWNYTITTIAGSDFYTYGSQGRTFQWDRIVRNLWWWTETATDTYDTTSATTTAYSRYIVPFIDWKLTTVLKDSLCTATRCILKQWWTTLATTTFSWNTATFNYTLSKGVTYTIESDNSWATYNWRYKANWSAITNDYFTLNAPDSSQWNIVTVNMDFVYPSPYTLSTQFNKSSWWSDSTWNSANTAVYYWQTHYLYINKSDYSSISFSSLNHYTVPWTYPDDSSNYSLTTTNHLADTTVATLTEISITLTLSTNNYFIPCAMNIKKIEITAVSSWWNSAWVWTYREWNSCTAKYGTTTAFVDNYIFKTDASNLWSVVWTRTNWFLMTWTTNTSNKLDYICT